MLPQCPPLSCKGGEDFGAKSGYGREKPGGRTTGMGPGGGAYGHGNTCIWQVHMGMEIHGYFRHA